MVCRPAVPEGVCLGPKAENPPARATARGSENAKRPAESDPRTFRLGAAEAPGSGAAGPGACPIRQANYVGLARSTEGSTCLGGRHLVHGHGLGRRQVSRKQPPASDGRREAGLSGNGTFPTHARGRSGDLPMLWVSPHSRSVRPTGHPAGGFSLQVSSRARPPHDPPHDLPYGPPHGLIRSPTQAPRSPPIDTQPSLIWPSHNST